MSIPEKLRLIAPIAFIGSAALTITYWLKLFNMEPDSCGGISHYFIGFSKYCLLIPTVSFFFISVVVFSWQSKDIKLRDQIITILFSPNGVVSSYVVASFISFYYRDQCPGLNGLVIVGFVVGVLICAVPIIAGIFLALNHRRSTHVKEGIVIGDPEEEIEGTRLKDNKYVAPDLTRQAP